MNRVSSSADLHQWNTNELYRNDLILGKTTYFETKKCLEKIRQVFVIFQISITETGIIGNSCWWSIVIFHSYWISLTVFIYRWCSLIIYYGSDHGMWVMFEIFDKPSIPLYGVLKVSKTTSVPGTLTSSSMINADI